MKPLTAFPILLVISGLAVGAESDLSSVRKQVEASLDSFNAVAHFDQPYAGTANRKQMLDLYLPKKPADSRPLPVVVFVHGGAWKNGDRITSSNVLRFVKTGRYAGISIGYRLSDEAKWPAQIHDCKAAIRWIRGRAGEFNLDPDRIGVWGSSAGGHLVSMLGTSGGVKELEGDLGEFDDFSSRVTCVVDQCGPTDFALALMKRNGERVIEDPAVVDLICGAVKDHRALLQEASPVSHVTADDAPFLILHGTADERVSFEQAERIDAALKAAGVESLLIPVIDGRHRLTHPGLAPLLGKFFARHLRGQNVEIDAAPLKATETVTP
jgi:acetyl esterase/lipase